jgi:hypothetical protein
MKPIPTVQNAAISEMTLTFISIPLRNLAEGDRKRNRKRDPKNHADAKV